MSDCPFCKCDPFEYVDVGVGYVPVAISCCDLGIALYGGDKKVRQIARLKSSPNPRHQARAKRLIQQFEDE